MGGYFQDMRPEKEKVTLFSVGKTRKRKNQKMRRRLSRTGATRSNKQRRSEDGADITGKEKTFEKVKQRKEKIKERGERLSGGKAKRSESHKKTEKITFQAAGKSGLKRIFRR